MYGMSRIGIPNFEFCFSHAIIICRQIELEFSMNNYGPPVQMLSVSSNATWFEVLGGASKLVRRVIDE